MPPRQTAMGSGEPAAATGTTTVDSGDFSCYGQLSHGSIQGWLRSTVASFSFWRRYGRESTFIFIAPRAVLLCEGTAFKKEPKISAEKLKTSDESGIKLLVATLGGSWGKTALEEKYDTSEKAIYSTAQKADETNDSYLDRHDVHFEELLAQGVTMEEVRAYVLLRQSQLSAEDRKKIVVEMGGKLEYSKVVSAIRLLGSRFFADLQGQRTARTKNYDANMFEKATPEEPERAFQATAQGLLDEARPELDAEFVEAMVAVEDPDALAVQGFEEELEGFFQDTPDLQEALVSYLEARQKLPALRVLREPKAAAKAARVAEISVRPGLPAVTAGFVEPRDIGRQSARRRTSLQPLPRPPPRLPKPSLEIRTLWQPSNPMPVRSLARSLPMR